MYPGVEAATENILGGTDYLFSGETLADIAPERISPIEDAFAATPDHRSSRLEKCRANSPRRGITSRDTVPVFFSTRGAHVWTHCAYTPCPRVSLTETVPDMRRVSDGGGECGGCTLEARLSREFASPAGRIARAVTSSLNMDALYGYGSIFSFLSSLSLSLVFLSSFREKGHVASLDATAGATAERSERK